MRTCVLSFLLLLALHSFGCSRHEPLADSPQHKCVLILTVDTLRPELVYPLRARAEAREALGDREGGAADRDLACRQAERKRRLRPAGGTPSGA